MTHRSWAVLAAVFIAMVTGGVWLTGDDGDETVAAEAVPTVGQERDDGTVPTRTGDAELVGDDLSFAVDSCNQNPTAEVDEDDTTVTITAYAPPRGGDDCADGLVVHLEQPLGDRMVFDGATGMTVTVRRPDWIIPGDYVRIVGDYTSAGGSSDAAVLFAGPDDLAQVWPETGVPGPAPVFDGDRSDAVLIRVIDPSVCPELYEALIVDGSLLRFQVMAEDGSERPCTSPAQPGHRVVVALVAERTPGGVPDGMAEPLEAVSYRERQVPLERPDTE